MRILPLLLYGGVLALPGTLRGTLNGPPGVPPGQGSAAVPDAGVRFVPNRGQWAPEVRFAGLGTDSWFCADGWTLRLERRRAESTSVRGVVVRMAFEGGDAEDLSGLEPQTPRHHFVRGGDPAAWVRDVPAFGGIRYRSLYPGVDAVVRSIAEPGVRGLFEYDLHLRPGAALEDIVVRCDGVERLSLRADGALELHLRGPDGEPWSVVQHPPVSWRAGADVPIPVASSFRLLGGRRFGFRVDEWDGGDPLVIDPGIAWSSFLGGGASDVANAVRWIEGDGVFVGGWSGSMDFPATPGAYQTVGQRDAIVAKFSEDGSQLLYATYLGGRDGEEVRGLDVDSTGAVTVVGLTNSDDFPTTAGALQSVYGGASVLVATGDAFVSRLSADGTTLLASTYVGGAFDEVAHGVAVDAAGVATVVGWTMSTDFPVTAGAPQSNLHSVLPDGFVTRVSADGRSALFSTYLGGISHDEMHAVRVDAAGVTTVSGQSDSRDYPTTLNAFRGSPLGSQDAVVTRLSADGRSILWSTYLGGSDGDRADGLALRSDGSVVVCGATDSPGFTTTAGALQTTHGGGQDGFVSVLNGTATGLLYGSFFGGAGDDIVRAVDVDSGGEILLVGDTAGGIPITTNASQPVYGGGVFDAFVARLDASGTSLAFSTYLGGAGHDVLSAVDYSDQGLAVVAGRTFSTDWPVTTGVVQTALDGTMDACVAQIDTISLLDGSASFAPLPQPESDSFATGESFVALAVQLQNDTPRPLEIRGVSVLVAGAGDNVSDLVAARLYDDVDRDGEVGPGDVLVAGPVPLTEDNAVVALTGNAVTIAPGTAGRCLVQLESGSACAPGAEFACAVLDHAAWDLVAVGPGGGPGVVLRGVTFVQGTVWTCGAPLDLNGDQNGDGRLDVSDLRRLARRLGEAPTGPDPDGDGVVTDRDLDAVMDRILERPVVLAVPSEIAAGGTLTLGGHGLMGSVSARIGGRALSRESVTSRELVLRADAGTPPGSHAVVVDVRGRRVVDSVVTVR